MPSITVPKEFFVKERRMYTHWESAFWREFFQNSVDAGAQNIAVHITNDADTINVIFEDDGCGMDREILEGVYFRLGASTKTRGDTVGGFGRARILTCFSMDSYRIHTRDNLVVGDGGEYEISETSYRFGTEVQVRMRDESRYYLEQALEDYLRASQMSCRVLVNGTTWTNWTYRREVARTLELDGVEFANVHVNKSAKTNKVIVRVAGATMFTKWVNMNAQVIVEIFPAISRKVLMANRDSLMHEYMRVLDSFIAELSTETLTALKPKNKLKTATFEGAGLFVNYSKRAIQCDEPVETADVAVSDEVVGVRRAEKFILNGVAPVGATVSQAIERLDISKITTNLSHGGRYLPTLPTIHLLDETELPAMRRVIDQYDPNNWVTIYNRGKPTNRGSTIYKVLMMWKIACDMAVEALLTTKPDMSSLVWGIGWVFNENVGAKHVRTSGGSLFLLNPVCEEGNLRFFVTDQASQKRMMAYAKHEVAHHIELMHNETFASAMTMIDANYDEREVYKRIRALNL